MAKSAKKNASEPAGQVTLSSFFTQTPSPRKTSGSKRAASPIDLTSDPEPAPKKARVAAETASRFFSQASASSARSGTPPRSAHPGPAEQWRFEPPSPEKERAQADAPPLSAEEVVRRKLRRDAFKKKLLGEKNPFLQRRASETIDEEDHDLDGMDVAWTSKTAVNGKGKEKEVVEICDGEEDSKFKELEAMFALKPNTKGRAKAARGKTKGLAKETSTGRKPAPTPAEVGPSGETWTALELQVVQLKKDNPGTLLMIEVGYKYRFFGEDAKVASKELGIVCYPSRNFLVASIPVHRRDIHIKKLLSQGFKVGIVGQTETAALKKAGDNRNTLFTRGLQHLYTATTYVDDLDSPDDVDRHAAPPLMCVVEQPLSGGMGADERVRVGMVVIAPSTGDVVWDEFDDGLMRTELETRLVHTKPSELLLSSKMLSRPSETMLTHFISGPAGLGNGKTRIERYDDELSYTDAFDVASKFYTDKTAGGSASFASGELMAAVTDFPRTVVVALAHAIAYLGAFRIAHALRETAFFTRFATRAHMLLNGNTLANLEIYRNQTDGTTRGSLMWILDQTTTKFGARLLKSWVGRPLVDKEILQQRIDAVEEVCTGCNGKIVTLRAMMRGLPDLAKGLCRIQYGKATPQELATLLRAFNKIATAFEPFTSPSAVGCRSPLLNRIFFGLPQLREPVRKLMSVVVLKKADEGKKEEMWADAESVPELCGLDEAMQLIEHELNDELKSIRKVLKQPALKFTESNGEEYLVEVKKTEDRFVPPTWHVASSTKYVRRYHTPEVKKKLEERGQYQEALQIKAQEAFLAFLDEIAREHYGALRDVVNQLATADCLLSFAQVASREGYCKPEFTDEDVYEIVEARHPTLEKISADPIIPNSCTMGGGLPRSKIITGPNMGGKSSCVRMIALIAIMAQIGAYVPAKSAKLNMLDGVLTRMGAFDELAKGRSTFMVELTETSDILRVATSKSLVILDELGRGTSTFDGMAIADAVLQHLVQNVKCKTLFITHYPLVATDIVRRFPSEVENLHMGFIEEDRIDGTTEITFLYRLTAGVASGSFGVECGRLAGLPEKILQSAAAQSEKMRALVEKRDKRTKIRKCATTLKQCCEEPAQNTARLLDQLRSMAISIHDDGASTPDI